jgi:hypothetical protein
VTVAASGMAAVLALVLWSQTFNRWSSPIGGQSDRVQSSGIARSDETPFPKPGTDQRTVRGDTAVANAKIISPQRGEKVDPRELNFRWSAAEGALFYELQVISDDGDVLWETRCHATSIRFPPTVHLVKGKNYYVRLLVHATGGSVEQSKPVEFVAD